jgi:restriction endonuclease
METGTGKTLVYLRTLYRLHTMYGWNKFIIAVPSVAIRAGVMGTLADFGLQLAQASGLNHPIPAFEYDSSRLQQLNAFIAQKESSLFSQLNSQAIRDEVLFKCGFQLDVQLEPINEVSANQLFQARDQQSPPREAIVCFDTHLSNTTLDWLCKQRGQRVIVLETALDTTSKWNLHHHLGDGLFVF